MHNDLFKTGAILLNALLIRRAWRPILLSSNVPSTSAFGTKAATESTTIRSIAWEEANISAISNACSPESGWDKINSSISTPSTLAYSGSIACSASINAALPPAFWHSAIACNANVVLPEDSGP